MIQFPKHIMVDLETLSSEPNAAVISIGAVQFDASGLGQEFYVVLNVEEQERLGRHISPSTFKWWCQQSEEARKVFTEIAQPVDHALALFTGFCGDVVEADATQKPPYDLNIWGYGSTFDNVVLRNLYKALGAKAPWTYRGDLCYRTLMNLCKGFTTVPQRKGTHHNALDDAKYQAQCAVIYFQRMGFR